MRFYLLLQKTKGNKVYDYYILVRPYQISALIS